MVVLSVPFAKHPASASLRSRVQGCGAR